MTLPTVTEEKSAPGPSATALVLALRSVSRPARPCPSAEAVVSLVRTDQPGRSGARTAPASGRTSAAAAPRRGRDRCADTRSSARRMALLAGVGRDRSARDRVVIISVATRSTARLSTPTVTPGTAVADAGRNLPRRRRPPTSEAACATRSRAASARPRPDDRWHLVRQRHRCGPQPSVPSVSIASPPGPFMGVGTVGGDERPGGDPVSAQVCFGSSSAPRCATCRWTTVNRQSCEPSLTALVLSPRSPRACAHSPHGFPARQRCNASSWGPRPRCCSPRSRTLAGVPRTWLCLRGTCHSAWSSNEVSAAALVRGGAISRCPRCA